MYIFLFHGIGKKELRDSWKSLGIFNWKFLTASSSAESQNRCGKTETSLDVLEGGSRKPGTGKNKKDPREHGVVNSVQGTPQLDEIRKSFSEGPSFDWGLKRGSCDMLLKDTGKTVVHQKKGGDAKRTPQAHMNNIIYENVKMKEEKADVSSKDAKKTATDVSV